MAKDIFEFSIKNGAQYNSYRVVKIGEELVLTVAGDAVVYRLHRLLTSQFSHEFSVKLNDEEWEEFWNELKSAGVWKYDTNYKQQAFVCDGTSWSISATYKDKEINSSGGNAYPGVKGTRYGVKFKKLLNALSKRFPDEVEIGLWSM